MYGYLTCILANTRQQALQVFYALESSTSLYGLHHFHIFTEVKDGHLSTYGELS